MEASVRFNETDLPSRTIVDLARARSYASSTQSTEPLTLYVGRVPYLSGLAGRRRPRKAFAVIGPTAEKGADL